MEARWHLRCVNDRVGDRVIVKCSHCGAPLDVSSSAKKVKCAYCRMVNVVQQAERVADQTPPGWVPPPKWTPPPNRAGGQPLAYRPTAGAGRMPIVFILLGVGATGLAATMFAGGGSTLFGEWLGTTCLVDANGDDVLDPVGALGQPTSPEIPLVILDGKSGKKLATGGDVDWGKGKQLCLGRDLVGYDTPSFTVELRRPKGLDILGVVKVPDRTDRYGVAKGCLRLVTSAKAVTAATFDAKPTESCPAPERPTYPQAGYTEQSRGWWQKAGELTYVIYCDDMGTSFINVLAIRGELPASLTDSFSTYQLNQALPTLSKVWSTKLRFATARGDVPGVLLGQTLVTWGVDPTNDKAGGVLIGIDLADGKLRYAESQGSPTWSTNLRELQTNGRDVLATWGYGLFAYEADTGKRLWNVGGR
jgi:LSD1 subclass zinc finger protein